MRRLIGAIAVVSGLLWGAVPAVAERNIALVIGNSAYRASNITPLPNPANDADAVSALLGGIGYTVINVVDGTIDQMDAALTRLEYDAREADSVVVFYAGHGIQVSGQNFLLPVDAEIESVRDLRRQAVSLEDIFATITLAQPRVSIVILDACRNNPLSRSLAARLGRAFGVGRGLAPVSDARGILVAYATAPNEVAADGAGANSPFTAALVEHLPTPGIDVRTMFARVRETVVERTQGRQTPWTEDGLVGEFAFAAASPKAIPEVTAAPATQSLPAGVTVLPALDKETVFWQSAERQDTVKAYQAYMTAFPEGTYIPLARANIAVLKRRQEASDKLGNATASPSPAAATTAAPPAAGPPAVATPSPPPAVQPLAMAPGAPSLPAGASATQLAAVPVRPKPADDVPIEPIGETYFPIANTNVRSRPSTKGRRLTTLAMGTEVNVVGKVVGADWYKVTLADGTTGYVYAKLLVLAKSASQLGQTVTRVGDASQCDRHNDATFRAIGHLYDVAEGIQGRLQEIVGDLRVNRQKRSNSAVARRIYDHWIKEFEGAERRIGQSLSQQNNVITRAVLQAMLRQRSKPISVAEVVARWPGADKKAKSRNFVSSMAVLAKTQSAAAQQFNDKMQAADSTRAKLDQLSSSCGIDFRCALALQDGRQAFDELLNVFPQLRQTLADIAGNATQLTACMRAT